MGNITQVECQACVEGDHLCSDCGGTFCIDHIHRHPPCTNRRNSLVAMRFAVADASGLVDAAIQMHKRLQAALKLLEELPPEPPAPPTFGA